MSYNYDAYKFSKRSASPYDLAYRKNFGTDAWIANMFSYNLNQESANAQMKFQDYMSSTSHQREVKDLLAAGLNPVLSANSGAATGAGASATADNIGTSAKVQQNLLKKQLAFQGKQNAKERAQNLKIANDQMKNQAAMNKYSTDLSYQLGLYQSDLNYAAQLYGANASAAATRAAASMAAYANMYNTDVMNQSYKDQRKHEKQMQATQYIQNKAYYQYQLEHQLGLSGSMASLIAGLMGFGNASIWNEYNKPQNAYKY